MKKSKTIENLNNIIKQMDEDRGKLWKEIIYWQNQFCILIDQNDDKDNQLNDIHDRLILTQNNYRRLNKKYNVVVNDNEVLIGKINQLINIFDGSELKCNSYYIKIRNKWFKREKKRLAKLLKDNQV